VLYPKFFRAFHEEITKNSVPMTMKLVGAGGERDIPARRISEIRLTLAGKEVTIEKAEDLVQRSALEASRSFYANLGRDVLVQFERVTYDFRAMTLSFE